MKRIVVALAFTMLGGVALAHHTGNERRTPKECEELGKERDACMACVGRPKPHHYHPGDMKGERCNPDDGMKH